VIRDVTGYQPLVPVAAATAVGILGDRFWPWPAPVWFLTAALALGLWLPAWRRRYERVGAVLLGIGCAATGAAWHHACWSLFPRDDLGHYARATPEPACLEAIALKSGRLVPPAPRDPLQVIPSVERTRVELAVRQIRHRTEWRTASGNVGLLIEGRRTDIRAGDRLRVYANLAAPWPAQNPGQFDMARYLRTDRQRAMLHADHAESVVRLDPCPGRELGFAARVIDAVRRYNKQQLDRYLNPARAGLAGAVLLGAREELDPEQSAAFLETGTVHLLVVSGLNVGILAAALWKILKRIPIPRVMSVLLVGTVTSGYMILTDAEPPIVRATVLILGSMLALLAGRQGKPFNTLAAAALVVLAINPVDLFNVGAQLSFLCVAGMVWFVPGWIDAADNPPELQRLIERSRTRRERLARGIWQLLVMSLLLSVLTGPLVAARFHLLAPVAPVLNVILWLPVLTGTLSGFGLLVLGWIWPLGYLLGGVCDKSMWALQWGVDLARRLPASHFWTVGPADWWLAGLYGGLALAIVWPGLSPRGWKVACVLLIWCLIGYVPTAVSGPGQCLECTFLSVGHGVAVVLRLPDGRTMLYDAGRLSRPRVPAAIIEGYLWSCGISRLDAIVLSHADTDHYNAVPELLDRFRVDAIYVSPRMFARSSRAVDALERALKRSGITPRALRAGQTVCEGPCTMRVLHPPGAGILGSDNANSLVLVVEYQRHRILLPGDLESVGLDELLANPPVRCDVVLAPHHGSRRSQPRELLDWAAARWIVVSGDIGPKGEDESLAEDARHWQVLHTGRHGAVTVRVTKAGLAVTGYLDPRPDSVQPGD
jgi:competence protein ComEC